MKAVVLISGSGSNLQALIESSQQQRHFEIIAVISDRSDAYGLIRAEKGGITTANLLPSSFASRTDYDLRLQQLIDSFAPDMVLLAGFMRILSDDFVHHYSGRMLNIHPSLLPKFRGLHTHQRAIDAGEKEAGCTVHFVTPELDAGPIVAQARVAIFPDDDAETLASRVLHEEHRLYPTVSNWYAQGRLKLEGGIVMLDGNPISKA
ncbi:MAG: phosphoribosylglycinamide formyltransferase [Gammaproteobacteria bacterium]|nr:phosphoribosylglycinamide formyltransferase [Gammaproteobacteria bacterium]